MRDENYFLILIVKFNFEADTLSRFLEPKCCLVGFFKLFVTITERQLFFFFLSSQKLLRNTRQNLRFLKVSIIIKQLKVGPPKLIFSLFLLFLSSFFVGGGVNILIGRYCYFQINEPIRMPEILRISHVNLEPLQVIK